MLQKNVITEVPPTSPGFYSNVFLVRKASGWCPVIDLKSLNTHIWAPHFRMFTTSSVLSTVPKGDSLWSEHSPSGFYSFGAHGDTVDRRLADSPSRPTSPVTTSDQAFKKAGPGRFCSKLKEIRAFCTRSSSDFFPFRTKPTWI